MFTNHSQAPWPSHLQPPQATENHWPHLPHFPLAGVGEHGEKVHQILHHMHQSKGFPPQTLWTTKTTPNPDLSLGLHLHGFHWATPTFQRFHLHPCMVVDKLTKNSLFIPTHDSIITQWYPESDLSVYTGVETVKDDLAIMWHDIELRLNRGKWFDL